MKILITGAHFTPAIATIEELKKYQGTKIVYVGRKSTQEGDLSPSAESQILPLLGIKFIPIITGRLQRSFTTYTIPSLLKIPIGFLQAFWIIFKEKPDVILSFGGYVAVPIVFVGWLFSIPVITHEQTLVSGLANTISGWFADKIAISFLERNNFNKKKIILTGNPIRQGILNNLGGGISKAFLSFGKVGSNLGIFNVARKEKLPVILITGGNQGSHIINLAVESCLDKLKKIAFIIHVTGDSKFKDFERLENKQDDHYLVKKWINEEWTNILSKADLIISRAGINTLTEMAFVGKPGIVIPIPYLYGDEQNKNAKYFEKLGLVKILPQDKLNQKSLLLNINSMLNNLNNFNKNAKMAKKIIIPDAAKRLALETIILAS